jgi:hypothetical protein
MKNIYDAMMNALTTGKLEYRNEVSKSSWAEKPGIYAIWGDENLKEMLLPKLWDIHAGQRNGGVVNLNIKNAIKRSIKRRDNDKRELFCVYVGKTVHIKTRMNNHGHGKKLGETLELPIK